MGDLVVALQPQKNTFFEESAVNFMGEKEVSLCEPSQNGWFALSPQVHQK